MGTISEPKLNVVEKRWAWVASSIFFEVKLEQHLVWWTKTTCSRKEDGLYLCQFGNTVVVVMNAGKVRKVDKLIMNKLAHLCDDGGKCIFQQILGM
jgi:hypothetical protein